MIQHTSGYLGLKLTPSLEDYLKSIYILSITKREVRVSDIANYMNVRLPSVSEALKKLKDKGLIVYDRYSSISLTSKGYEIARNIVKRHQLILYFLQNILGLPPDIASKEACIMEHFISDETIRRLSIFIETFTKYCTSKILAQKLTQNGTSLSNNNGGENCNDPKNDDDVILWKH